MDRISSSSLKIMKYIETFLALTWYRFLYGKIRKNASYNNHLLFHSLIPLSHDEKKNLFFFFASASMVLLPSFITQSLDKIVWSIMENFTYQDVFLIFNSLVHKLMFFWYRWYRIILLGAKLRITLWEGKAHRMHLFLSQKYFNLREREEVKVLKPFKYGHL